VLDKIKQAVLEGEEEMAIALTKQAVDAGFSVRDIVEQALIPAMNTVGEEYERGVRYVPEMLISAEAMKGALRVLKPLLAQAGIKARGKVVIGTVEGDLHDIGKNLVAMMLEGAGFEVIDLGTEVAAEEFVAAVEEYKPDILGMSALLTTTMPHMAEVIEALKQAGIRDTVKILIGGAPVTEGYAVEIGADGYAPDAASAVRVAKQLLGVKT